MGAGAWAPGRCSACVWVGVCLQCLFLQAQQEAELCMEPAGCWCELGGKAAELWDQPLLEPAGTMCVVSGRYHITCGSLVQVPGDCLKEQDSTRHPHIRWSFWSLFCRSCAVLTDSAVLLWGWQSIGA